MSKEQIVSAEETLLPGGDNKTTHKKLADLMAIALNAIKDSYYSHEDKKRIFEVLGKAQVPIIYSNGSKRQMMPLGHVFVEQFKITELKRTEMYYPCHVEEGSDEFPVKEEEAIGDKVNNPSHYQAYSKDGVDCITAMQSAFGKAAVAHFCLCNAFKYIWRHSSKNGMEDIDKALWYLNKYEELKTIELGD